MPDRGLAKRSTTESDRHPTPLLPHNTFLFKILGVILLIISIISAFFFVAMQ